MSAAQCARRWEVEAARDGRLRGSAYAAFQSHLGHCADCAREHAAFERLREALRAEPAAGDDPISARRLRQRVLSEANRRLLEQAAPRARTRRGYAWIAAGVALLAFAGTALSIATWRRSLEPEPVALKLTAAEGARFLHERRRRLEYVELHDGSLDITFDRSSGVQLLVRTPDGELHDLGTAFRVTVEHGRTTRVSVRDGAVMLRRAGFADVMVSAGGEFRLPQESTPPEPAETSAQGAPATDAAAPDSVTTPVTAKKASPRGPRRDAVPTATRIASEQEDHAARRGAMPAARIAGEQEDRAARRDAVPTAARIAGEQEDRAARRDAVPTAARSAGEQEDRAYLRVLELLRAGRADDARAAAEAYQRAFPNGFRRTEIDRIAPPVAR